MIRSNACGALLRGCRRFVPINCVACRPARRGATGRSSCFGPKPHRVMVCPVDHALARRRRVKWAELKQHDSVMLAVGTGNRMLMDQALAARQTRSAWSCEVRHVPALVALVEAGIGIGVVPRFAIPSSAAERLACVALEEPAVSRTIGLIRRRGRALTPAAQTFHDLLTRPDKSRPRPRKSRSVD